MNYLFKRKSKNNVRNLLNISNSTAQSSNDMEYNCCKYNIQIEIDIDIKSIFLNSPLSKTFKIIECIYERYNKGTYIVTNNDMKYILKIRHNTLGNGFEKDIVNILHNYSHPNIIKHHCFFQDDEYYFMIYEYIEGTNLFEYIKTKKNIPEDDIKNIMIQLTNAIQFLHSHNIIHCDLKLDNIIITKDQTIKVIDYDLSIICTNNEGYISSSIFGTMQYIAPESYDLCIYSKKTDIWQLGIILYILITQKFPHDCEITLVNSYSNLCRQNIFKHIDLSIAKEIILKNNYDINLFHLLENMLTFDESKRINIDDILKNNYIKKN